MNSLKSHFKFNKQERSGIFFLLLFITIFQIGYFLIKVIPFPTVETVQTDIKTQTLIDSLKIKQMVQDSTVSYAFNPNFITDFKGYSIGMSVEEIDRLLAFRRNNNFINSSEEFQEVTLISDSLLTVIAPYFKFPDWTQQRGNGDARNTNYPTPNLSNKLNAEMLKDLNAATAEELKIIKGIGEVLSLRIIKFRDRLGGFLVEDQLQDVYGLEAEVVQRIIEKFPIVSKPAVKRISVNSATKEELAALVYLGTVLAQRIIDHRKAVGTINSLDELMLIEGFPTEKIDRIKLYLQL